MKTFHFHWESSSGWFYADSLISLSESDRIQSTELQLRDPKFQALLWNNPDEFYSSNDCSILSLTMFWIFVWSGSWSRVCYRWLNPLGYDGFML